MPAVSRIHDDIVYVESKKIEDEDLGYNSPVYELDIGDNDTRHTYTVVIGKPKYTYSQSKNVVYFPIYAVSGHVVRSQIGVFEFESSKLLNAFQGGELNLTRLAKPVLYDFATPDYLAKTEAVAAMFDHLVPGSDVSTHASEPSNIVPILEQEQEEDMFRVQTKPKSVDTDKMGSKPEEKHIFEQGTIEPLEPLPEETQEDADQNKTEYVESLRNTWIEKYLKTNHFRIHENEGGGDCFFAVVRDAYAQIGKKTTVDKLRSILADEVTDSVFQEYKSLYLGFMDEIKALEREMTQIKQTIDEYKKRVTSTRDASAADSKKLIEDSKVLAEKHALLKKEKAEAEKMQTDYAGYMKDVDTLDKMRQYIRTSSFWADAWAIATLERVLNMKMIILSEKAYEDGDMQGVVQCGEVSKELQERRSFQPEHYIVTTYTGNHYRLVSYKSRKIMTFREVPYDLKVFIVNKCLEKNAGPFYMIQDFRDLKSKFGIDADEGHPDDFRDLPGAGELFDPEVVFVFYAKSDKSTKPGAGEGEALPKSKVADYAPLANKAQVDWRKKLDDDWDKTTISVDGKRWASVTHYVLGARYKKGHPDLYHLFSLDSADAGNVPEEVKDIATNLKTARAFKGLRTTTNQPDKTDKTEGKNKVAAPKVKPVVADMDYDEDVERELALIAKFKDNIDLGTTLRLTKRALLLHKEKPGVPLKPDVLLMRVRGFADANPTSTR